MQIYNYYSKMEETQAVSTEPASIPDGCFLGLHHSPDLIVTQGADLEVRLCAELATRTRPTIACLGPDYLTVDLKTCAIVGDLMMSLLLARWCRAYYQMDAGFDFVAIVP